MSGLTELMGRNKMKNNLDARLKEWEALKAEGGTQRTKMVRNGFGKLDAFHRPGSQKK